MSIRPTALSILSAIVMAMSFQETNCSDSYYPYNFGTQRSGDSYPYRRQTPTYQRSLFDGPDLYSKNMNLFDDLNGDLNFNDDDFLIEFTEKANLKPFQEGISQYAEYGSHPIKKRNIGDITKANKAPRSSKDDYYRRPSRRGGRGKIPDSFAISRDDRQLLRYSRDNIVKGSQNLVKGRGNYISHGSHKNIIQGSGNIIM